MPFILSDTTFTQISEFIKEKTGIHIPNTKKYLVENRLFKVLEDYNLKGYDEYLYLLKYSSNGKEVNRLFDAITTNETFFFREPLQFDVFLNHILPSVIERKHGMKNIRIWSAASSSGEEPYTLAMVLKEFQAKLPDFSFNILGTDICTDVLEKAVQGIYSVIKAEPIPEALKKKYLLRSKDPENRIVRVSPELRSLARFRRLNFMDDDFGFREPFDIIFCRNVIIYFDRPTQEKLLAKLVDNLAVGRYIFLGHSETLLGLNLPLQQMAPSVYRRV